ncbi:MAG: hypothetical protein GXY08_00325 [Ruminococcus sp.]|nr:hypothetical protein [Ruminococcus sp.]
MELIDYFKGAIETLSSPMVICNLDYKIIFMNKAAKKRYQPHWKTEMNGTSMRCYFNEEDLSKLDMSIEWFKEDINNNRVFAFHDDEQNQDVYIRAIRSEDGTLQGFFNYHESREPEKGKEYDLD